MTPLDDSPFSEKPTPGEFDLIRWFRGRPVHNRDTVLGIGDDCAIVRRSTDTDLVITTDMLMDGRHFRLGEHSPEEVGFKAMGVNLSDIAAMAARPIASVVSIALPRLERRVIEIAKGLHQGLSNMAKEFDVALVGGDTNAWNGPLVVCVTVLGETTDQGAVRRSGARPGDQIFVTGPLGGSLLGRHLRPTPRITEALALHRAVAIHALTDLSDGLSADLGHILEESGNLGAVLDTTSIPVHSDVQKIPPPRLFSDLDHALSDGEDFELCLVVAPEDAERLLKEPPSPTVLYRVGEIVENPGIWLRDSRRRLTRLKATGFDHLKS
ncbi:MAG: thiamine-phosphate kinase [Isosphaeraceae bacterium]